MRKTKEVSINVCISVTYSKSVKLKVKDNYEEKDLVEAARKQINITDCKDWCEDDIAVIEN